MAEFLRVDEQSREVKVNDLSDLGDKLGFGNTDKIKNKLTGTINNLNKKINDYSKLLAIGTSAMKDAKLAEVRADISEINLKLTLELKKGTDTFIASIDNIVGQYNERTIQATKKSTVGEQIGPELDKTLDAISARDQAYRDAGIK